MCHKGQMLEGEDFERSDILDIVVEQVKPLYPHLRCAMLFGDGEPILYKGFWGIVADIRKASPRCAIEFINNGSLINDVNIKKCLEYEISHMALSMGGATAETHNYIRKLSDFNSVVSNYKKLNNMKKQSGVTEPYLTALIVVMRSNYKEMSQFIELCDSMGIIEVELQQLFVTHPSMEEETVSSSEVEPYFQKAGEMAKKLGICLRHYPLESKENYLCATDPSKLNLLDSHFQARWFPTEEGDRGYCKNQQPWNTAYVLYDGKVVPDCHWWASSRKKHLNSYGTLSESINIMDIWNGPVAEIIRNNIVEGSVLPQCRGCGVIGGVKDEFRSEESDHIGPDQEIKKEVQFVSLNITPKQKSSKELKADAMRGIVLLSASNSEKKILSEEIDIPPEKEKHQYDDSYLVETDKFIFELGDKLPQKYVQGYEQYKNSGVVDDNNIYVRFLIELGSSPHVITTFKRLSEDAIVDAALGKFRLVESITEHGYDDSFPVSLLEKKFVKKRCVTNTMGKKMEYTHIDGHHRVVAAKYAGVKHIPVRFGEILWNKCTLRRITSETQKRKWEWYQPINFKIPDDSSIPFQNSNDILNGVKKYNFILRKNIKHIKGKTVLDLGCNSGLITSCIAKDGAKLAIGVDFQSKIDQAVFVYFGLWADLGNLTFKSMDLRNTDEFYSLCCSMKPDCILMSNSLYYLGDSTDEFVSICKLFSKRIVVQCNNLKKEQGIETTRVKNIPSYRGEFSQVEGVSRILSRHGYQIEVDAPNGYSKPVVVGNCD